MSFTISQNSPIAPSYDHRATEKTHAEILASKMLAAGGELRELERDGLGLDFDRDPEFKAQLVATLTPMLAAFKADHHIEGELGASYEEDFINEFIANGRRALIENPALISDLQLWLTAIVDPKKIEGQPSAPVPQPLSSYSLATMRGTEHGLAGAAAYSNNVNTADTESKLKTYELANSIASKLEKVLAAAMKESSSGEMVIDVADTSYLPTLTNNELSFVNPIVKDLKISNNYDQGSYWNHGNITKLKNELQNISDYIAAEFKRKDGIYADSISESDGRNIWRVYESKLALVSKEREILYKELKDSIAVQEKLNNIRSKISDALKSKPKLGTNEDLDANLTQNELDFLETHGIDKPSNLGKKGGLEVLSENISNKVKQLSDDSQLTTTDLQDAISRHNNLSEAISKLIQKMYETSKSFVQ